MLPRPYYSEPDVRKRQIDTLKIFNDNVIECSENSEYRVDFTAGGMNMSLNVYLSPDFPNEKPVILVNPAIRHPWVGENSNQVIRAPGLVQYTVHSDLGRVVQAIIREFQKTVPNMVQNDESSSQTSSPQSQNIPQLMFPMLADLTNEELQEILENPDLQDKILENNPILVELDIETEEVMKDIEDIAKENLSKQQVMDDLKTDIIDRISTIVQMKINFEEMNKKHQRLSEMYDPHNIRETLKLAGQSADEEAESIAEQFLLGNVPVEAFITKFAEKRALGQSRRAREDRLAHQLAQLDKATI